MQLFCIVLLGLALNEFLSQIRFDAAKLTETRKIYRKIARGERSEGGNIPRGTEKDACGADKKT